jgi:hypothetical protein
VIKMELLLVLSDVEYCGKNRVIVHTPPSDECIFMDVGSIPVNLNFTDRNQMETYNKDIHHIHGDLYMFGDEYVIEVKGLEAVRHSPNQWCECK